MQILLLMIGLLVASVLSAGGFEAVESSIQATRVSELIAQIDQIESGMREYNIENCMLVGYLPNGAAAPSCTTADWPTNVSSVQQAGFLPANFEGYSPLPVGGQTEPIQMGGVSPYLGFVSVVLPSAGLCNGVQSHFTSSSCNGSTLRVYVQRNENSGWNLANSGNIFIPPGL